MKPFVTLLTLAIVAGVQAQPVLTFQENAPVPGTSYLLHFGPFVDPGSAGADQTWDMSGLTTDSTMNITLAAPGTVIGNEAFPGATVAETGNEATMFWRVENEGVHLVGSLAEDVAIVYSDEGKYLQFPCTYQTAWTDDVAASFEVEEMTVTRTGNIDVIADGHGTLIMPDATIPNVLRLHWVENTTDMMAGFEMNAVYDSYLYYVEGRSYPLVQLVTGTISFLGNETTVQFTQWNGDISTDIETASVPDQELQAWPNPAQDLVSLRVPAEMAGEVFIQFHDATGKAVYNGRFMTDVNRAIGIPLDQLNSGIHMVTAIDAEGRTATIRLIVQ